MDVAQKLADAGWGPKTNGGDEIIAFESDECGLFAGIVRRGHHHGVDWNASGRASRGIELDLVPLPAPEQPERLSDERLSDHRIRQIINYESGDAKTASNARIFEERWELANEASAMRSGVAKMAVRESELTQELAELREQVATLARERDRYRDLCRRFRECFEFDGYGAAVKPRCNAESICRDYDATHTDTPAPEPGAGKAVIDAAVRYVNAGNEIPGVVARCFAELVDAVRAWESEVHNG
jgi:hypothetical protein